jgi:hypothetical protein
MGRRSTVEKNRVYVECTDAHRRVKGQIISLDEHMLKVELPTGAVMELTRRNQRSVYAFQAGLLEFISDGKLVV